ncbi:MAG TPA: hypothetical protein VIE91_03315 [Methylophilaceae bacterium]|jgi:hypothetical protein
MHKLIFSIAVFLISSSTLAEPQAIDNTLPPCDNSVAGNKPPCSTDSDSIKIPPKTRDDDRGVIVPPEIPAQGLPDRSQDRGRDIIDDSKPENNNKR